MSEAPDNMERGNASAPAQEATGKPGITSNALSGDEKDLQLLIASRFPIVCIETHEEERALQLVQRCAQRLGLPLRTWSITTGLRPSTGGESRDPGEALKQLIAERRPGVTAWLDLHPFLSNPVHVRLLKESAASYQQLGQTSVIIGYRTDLPGEVERLSVKFALSLPDADAIRAIVKREVQAYEVATGTSVTGQRDAFESMLAHSAGMTDVDIRRLVRQAIQDDGKISGEDLPRLIRGKHALLSRDSVLAFEMETAKFGDVAGLENLKAWLERRRPAFTGKGDARGLDLPKGIMLLGVQGCGKSLAAKAVAGAWGVPLMRLDFGALYNKFQGETERNLREALKAADAMSPCVLWIDEIEKGLASSDASSDGGVSRRVLGTLLTWMAERNSRVFIVATSNDIEQLPPELVRKGRLDEIFFVDLPRKNIRENILSIHLRKREVKAHSIDLPLLAQKTEGFSGAELETVVVAGLYEAHSHGEQLGTQHLLSEIERTKPLSIVMFEKIARLRLWARDRTVLADAPEDQTKSASATTSGGGEKESDK
jgi:AAA+ superfamily predicted ATPase